MKFRAIILIALFSVCAVWPQGLVLCVGEHGHVEFGPAGTHCCAAESEDCPECEVCVDSHAQNLAGAPARHSLSAPAALPPHRTYASDFDAFGASAGSALLPPPALAGIQSEVLLV